MVRGDGGCRIEISREGSAGVNDRVVAVAEESEEADDRDLVFLRKWDVNLRRRRPHKESQSEDTLLGHALEAGWSPIGIVAVIEFLQLNLAAEDSTFIVDHVEIR